MLKMCRWIGRCQDFNAMRLFMSGMAKVRRLPLFRNLLGQSNLRGGLVSRCPLSLLTIRPRPWPVEPAS